LIGVSARPENDRATQSAQVIIVKWANVTLLSRHDYCFAAQRTARLAWLPTLSYHFCEMTHRYDCFSHR
jgi:hypothetical protein